MSKKLSESLSYWRAERPSEWIMDELTRDAKKLEEEISTIDGLKSQVKLLKDMLQDKTVIAEPQCCGYFEEGGQCCGNGSYDFNWPSDVVELLSSTPTHCLAEIEANAVWRFVSERFDSQICEVHKFVREEGLIWAENLLKGD